MSFYNRISTTTYSKIMNVQNSKIGIRLRAVGMLESGISQEQIAKTLGVTARTIWNWKRRHEFGNSMDDKPRSGRPTKLTRVPKIIIKKSIGKRWKSTRNLAKFISTKSVAISKDTVHRYLRNTLGVKPYKRPSHPKLSEKQNDQRVQFCLKHKFWTEYDWKTVLFSDESPFELFHPANRQNDRVWSQTARNIQPVQTVKYPPKIMVWGMMSSSGLSELHIIPSKQSVNADYYISEVLEKCCLPALKRKKTRGPLTERRMCPLMSEAIFMQDGAPARNAIKTQTWLSQHIPGYWEKGVWPSNSPDLNPIENLWSIMQAELDKMKPATNLTELANSLKNVWEHCRTLWIKIFPKILF